MTKKLTFLLLLLASIAGAQQYPAAVGSTPYDGGSATNPFLAPDGTAAAPGFAFSGNIDMGLWRSSEAVIFQNTQNDISGRAYLQLQTEQFDLNAIQNGDDFDVAQFACYDDGADDMECYLFVNDGSNQSTTTFKNTGTSFTDPIGSSDSPQTAQIIFAPDSITIDADIDFDNDGTVGLNGGTINLLSPGTIGNQARIQMTSGTTIVLDADLGGATAGSVTLQANNAASKLVVDSAGNTFTGAILAPDGSGTATAYSFTGKTDMGMFRSTDVLIVHSDNDDPRGRLYLDGGTTSLYAIDAAGDLWGFGADPATSGIVTVTVDGVNRQWILDAPKALTETTATAIVRVTVASGAVTGFTVNWTVVADDATDFQSRRGSTYVAAVNKAGTEACVVSDVGTSAFAESAGASTLSVTTGCSTAPTNAVDFTIDATSSLTQTTLEATVSVVIDGVGIPSAQ